MAQNWPKYYLNKAILPRGDYILLAYSDLMIY